MKICSHISSGLKEIFVYDSVKVMGVMKIMVITDILNIELV